MTGIRITTRTDLKINMANIYHSISHNNSSSALRHLESAKNNIIMYYNTRGVGCDEFIPLFFKIKNLLRKFRKSDMYKRKVHGYLLELNRQLRGNINLGDEYSDKKIIDRLRQLSDDLMDDYSEFNLAGGSEFYTSNSQALELMRNDLLEMREMDSLFLKMDKERLPLMLDMLTSINACLMILPQAKEVTISTNTVKTFRTSFEGLFNIFSTLLMPVIEEKQKQTIASVENIVEMQEIAKTPSNNVQDERHFQRKTETVEKTTPERKNEEPNVENKSLNKMAKDLGMNLKEMERKAKEGLEDEPESKQDAEK